MTKLATGNTSPIALGYTRQLINSLHPAEIADLIESVPAPQRPILWELVDESAHGEILIELGEEMRADFARSMNTGDLVKATKVLDTDDLADILQTLPDAISSTLLRRMDAQNRARVEAVLEFDEKTAGGLMNTDTITVRADISLEVVLRYVRMFDELPPSTDSLMVVNRDDRYLGLLPISRLLTRDPEDTVAEVMDQRDDAIHAHMPDDEVARLFEQRDLISAAVIDDDGHLLGRVTIDDVVDVIRENADHSMLSMAGLNDEEDIFGAIAPSARRRAVWLGVNLLTAFLAAWVISFFQDTLERVVALAVLMPIVASMGGIAGSQTLTLVIRGLALGQVGKQNTRWLIGKEIAVGLLNGILWAAVVGVVATLWFGDQQLGAVIASALILNLLCAGLAGVLVPLALNRLSIDPALAGGVILTTVTDIVGFAAFLGLAAWWLL